MQIDAAQQNAQNYGMSDVDEKRAELRRKQLRQFIDERGLKIRAWARDAGLKSDGTIRNFLDGNTKSMTQETVSKLARAANVSVDKIFPEAAHVEVERVAQSHANKYLAETTDGAVGWRQGAQSSLEWPKDLKIIGHAKAGVGGFFLDQGEPIGMTRRTPPLAGVKDAFAVFIRDESMYPAFVAGHVAHIHPHRPVNPGDNVVVELHDGQCFIKQLKKRTAKQVICWQWNPAKEVSFDKEDVKYLYYVVGGFPEDW